MKNLPQTILYKGIMKLENLEVAIEANTRLKILNKNLVFLGKQDKKSRPTITISACGGEYYEYSFPVGGTQNENLIKELKNDVEKQIEEIIKTIADF